MARKKNIKELINKFVALLSQEIRIRKIILFGSYASGREHKHSDIDIAVISPDLGKRNELEEMTYLLKKAHQIDLDLEPHPYNPKEMKHPEKGSFVFEILKTGKVVYSS